MGFVELFAIAVALSMDAFAVSVGKGLSVTCFKRRNAFCCGLWFGVFQGLMPLAGFLLGKTFAGYIQTIDHWVAFVLLALIGGNMVRESFSEEEEKADACFTPAHMAILAVATSIDALAIGVTFAFLNVHIFPAVMLIGVTTFFISAVGVKIGSIFGEKYASRAELAGGIILIAMGCKILIQHLAF